MKSLKITALSLVLVLLLAACGAKVDTPDEPAVDPTPEPPIEQPVEKTPDERINDIIAGMSIEEKTIMYLDDNGELAYTTQLLYDNFKLPEQISKSLHALKEKENINEKVCVSHSDIPT